MCSKEDDPSQIDYVSSPEELEWARKVLSGEIQMPRAQTGPPVHADWTEEEEAWIDAEVKKYRKEKRVKGQYSLGELTEKQAADELGVDRLEFRRLMLDT